MNEGGLRAVTHAVGRYEDHASVDALLRILRRAVTSPLRLEILDALGTLEAWETIADIERVAGTDPDVWVRFRAVRTLETLHAARASQESP